jgi:hypothetical protein
MINVEGSVVGVVVQLPGISELDPATPTVKPPGKIPYPSAVEQSYTKCAVGSEQVEKEIPPNSDMLMNQDCMEPRPSVVIKKSFTNGPNGSGIVLRKLGDPDGET